MTNCQRAINIHPLPLALAKHSIYQPALRAESKTRAMTVPISHQPNACSEGEQGQHQSPGSSPELRPWRSLWKGNSEIRVAQHQPSYGLRTGISSGDLKNVGLCKQQGVAHPQPLSAMDPAQEKPPRSISELQGRDSPALPKNRTGGSRHFAFPTRAGEVKEVAEVYEVGSGRFWESFGEGLFFMITCLC